jgi:hypothetical protein
VRSKRVGRLSRDIRGPLKGASELASRPREHSETWPRIAHRRNRGQEPGLACLKTSGRADAFMDQAGSDPASRWEHPVSSQRMSRDRSSCARAEAERFEEIASGNGTPQGVRPALSLTPVEALGGSRAERLRNEGDLGEDSVAADTDLGAEDRVSATRMERRWWGGPQTPLGTHRRPQWPRFFRDRAIAALNDRPCATAEEDRAAALRRRRFTSVPKPGIARASDKS